MDINEQLLNTQKKILNRLSFLCYFGLYFIQFCFVGATALLLPYLYFDDMNSYHGAMQIVTIGLLMMMGFYLFMVSRAYYKKINL